MLRISIRNIKFYKDDSLYLLQFIINNDSGSSIAITKASIIQNEKNINIEALNYEKLIVNNNRKKGDEVISVSEIYSDKIPINVP